MGKGWGMGSQGGRLPGTLFLSGLLLAGLLLAAAFCWPLPEEAQASAQVMDAPQGKWIWVDVSQKRLTLYEGKTPLKSYAVATGTPKTPTPFGIYRINSRFAGEMSGFGTRFLGINVRWGQYGIHGTNKPESIGGNTSHGCIRLRVKDAEELYAAVPNGTLVVIEGGPYGDLDTWLKPLAPGDRGTHVRAVQNRLRALGYPIGSCDGVYGEATQRGVRQARRTLGLPDGDRVDWAFYNAIGLTLFE